MEIGRDTGIDADLLEALREIGRRRAMTVASLVNLALKEFLSSMDDELETYAFRPARSSEPYLATA